ncbi:hypothetical protein EVAR_89080_1 [Eumeta japonica]|uniref:Chitin-binding type-2 domain-containing protein n=1 Tax=Eumeta variegata TaxID=151549 RepID=A0A4C1XCU2_EUMVA|nr:hypothetical protein EVAR_89080_1 [Eumeta japonica]
MRLLVNLVVIATTVAIAFARPQLERQESFEILSNGCPVNWDIHHLLPHESDCRLFYYCVRGEKVLRECSPGTHFDLEQVCDWPENVGCQLAGGEDDSLEYEGRRSRYRWRWR